MYNPLWERKMRVAVFWAVILLGLVLSGGVALAEGAEQTIDIPLGHWSYAAVESLADTPLIAKSDVLFDNETSITRYEMALLIAKILRNLGDMSSPQKVEDGMQGGAAPLLGNKQEVLDHIFAMARNSDAGKGVLTDEHLALIKRLVEDFSNELQVLGLVEPLEARMGVNLLLDTTLATRKESGDDGDLWEEDSSEDDVFRLNERRSVIRGGSTLLKSEGWELGASIRKLLGEPYGGFPDETSKSVAALEGSLQVSPAVRVTGEYARNPEKSDDATSVKVGAQVKLGAVEVGAKYKTVHSRFDPLLPSSLEGKSSSGYDVSLNFGDVVLSTGKETLKSAAEAEGEPQTITSLSLKYGIAEDTVVKADYSYVNIEQLEDGDSTVEPGSVRTTATRRTALGVGVSVPKGSIAVGITYEDSDNPGGGGLSTRGATADIAYAAPWDEESTLHAGVSLEGAGSSKKKTTSFRLGYNFRKEASLVLGYKLIDFADADGSMDGHSENVTTAELSIRF